MSRRPWLAYGVSLAALAVIVIFRVLLTPLLNDHALFATLLVAVAFAAWYGGRGPAVLTLVTSLICATYLFLPPRYSFAVRDWDDRLSLVLSSLLGLATVGLIDSLQKARQQAEAKQQRLEEEVSARRTVERDLARHEQMLQEADRQKDDFLALLAHELRNPLAAVLNAVRLLAFQEAELPDFRQARRTIERQIGHLARLIDDLLDISRITHNRLELRRECVELADVVQSAVETSQPVIKQRGHTLTVALPREPVYLHADSVRLAQVFMNLLTNAAKYTEDPGHIRLTAHSQGDEVAVSVKDTGIGIPAEQLSQLFEMFFQLDRSMERVQGGLGIGLSLVKRLVELHDGTVEARSEGRNKGSEFIVRLPVLADCAHPAALTTAEVADRATTSAVHRVVVVDDYGDTAECLAMLLRLSGNEVHTARDGLAGVNLVEQVRPEVVLLDLGLPKLNGYEACRRIREQPWGKDITMVAMTGWGQEDDRRRTAEAGFNAHLVKPVDPTSLLDLLAECEPH